MYFYNLRCLLLVGFIKNLANIKQPMPQTKKGLLKSKPLICLRILVGARGFEPPTP